MIHHESAANAEPVQLQQLEQVLWLECQPKPNIQQAGGLSPPSQRAVRRGQDACCACVQDPQLYSFQDARPRNEDAVDQAVIEHCRIVISCRHQ